MTGIGLVVWLALAAMIVLMVARVVVDWLTLSAVGRHLPGWATHVVSVVRRLSDPVLAPIRRLLPAPRIGRVRVDFSPAVVMFGAGLLQPVALLL